MLLLPGLQSSPVTRVIRPPAVERSRLAGRLVRPSTVPSGTSTLLSTITTPQLAPAPIRAPGRTTTSSRSEPSPTLGLCREHASGDAGAADDDATGEEGNWRPRCRPSSSETRAGGLTVARVWMGQLGSPRSIEASHPAIPCERSRTSRASRRPASSRALRLRRRTDARRTRPSRTATGRMSLPASWDGPGEVGVPIQAGRADTPGGEHIDAHRGGHRRRSIHIKRGRSGLLHEGADLSLGVGPHNAETSLAASIGTGTHPIVIPAPLATCRSSMRA